MYQEATAAQPEHVTGVSYFDLEQGSLDTHLFTDTTYVARDDGVHAYKFRSDSPYIVQQNSDQPTGLRKRLMTMVLGFYRSQLTGRHAEMDVTVNGETLACWESDELVPPSLNSLQRNTIHIWLDRKGLPRRTETSTFNTLMGTTTKSRTEIEYNVVVPAETWAIPAGKEIVDPAKLLEKEYPLAGAAFTHEAAGQVFAVHEVGRDENGTVFAVISTRATEALRGKFAKFPQLLERQSLSIFLSGGDGSRSVTLASMEASGIHVKYVAMVGGGGLTGELGSVEMDPQAAGTTEKFGISLPATMPTMNADAFVGEAYDAVRGVDGIATADLRVVVRNKKHRWSAVGKSVSEISREEFLKESGRGCWIRRRRN